MAIKAMQKNPLWDKQVERNMEKAKEVGAALPDICPDLETCEKIPAGKGAPGAGEKAGEKRGQDAGRKGGMLSRAFTF